MVCWRRRRLGSTCKLLLPFLFFLADLNISGAQDYGDTQLSTNKQRQNIPQTTNNLASLKSMIDSLTKVSKSITEQTNLVKNNLQTFTTATPQTSTTFPLAVPLGESISRDKVHKPGNKRLKHPEVDRTAIENAQRWRFKLIKGTDVHFKEIFIGKCWDYQNRLQLLKQKINCNELWDAFVAGFAYKEPCNVAYQDYRQFFDMIKEGPLVNKSMLWSGARQITHELSFFNARFTALEDTFAGYLVDGMSWCGMTAHPGINYKHCPYECAKQKAYWGAAAEKMAKRSEGVVYAVINGTRQHWKDKQIFSAYMMDSYMARDQVPNLDPHKVTEVRIMVGHSLHQNVLERCGMYSVKKLEKEINKKGIKTICLDDPLSVRALLCLDYPRDPLCQFHLTLKT